ncbi:MAG TPA: ABC transporter permease [Terriglobia bacterium]|nr:ABC transporter permease [Terriglobia bacterium]
MPKLWFVVKREYLTRVATKGFIISTVAIPLFIIGLIVFQVMMAARQPLHTLRISIADETGQLGEITASLLAKQKLPDGRPAFLVSHVYEHPPSPESLRPKLTTMTRRQQLDGYLWIPSGVASGQKPELVVANPGAFPMLDPFTSALREAMIATRLKSQGVRVENLSTLLRASGVRLIHLTGKGESEDRGQAFVIAIAMATVLYGSLLMYGLTTMRSVLEEKTTRMMEILVSSVRPFELLAGKILGVAAVGLTQFLIWAISGGLLAAYGFRMVRGANPAGSGFHIDLPPAVLAYAVIYFIIGYFLFAAMYAAVGSVVSSEQDAQQLQMPITLLLVGSYILFGIVMRDPNSSVSVTLSMIPFFAPILMVIRIALEAPPLWQIGLSLLLLVLATLGVIYASARVYRVGILMYGKKPSLVEIFRWLRYS